jgi:hypothetical protein
MTGHIKNGASSWSTAVPAIYVKTAASTWSSAKSAWVKVNSANDATSWKQWFFPAVSDTFTRTTSGTLGVADLGGTWFNGVFSGSTGWYANGSTAYNADSQANSTTITALSTVEIGANNTFAQVTTSGGIGPIVWANYTGSTPTSWWGAIPYKIETATPYNVYSNYRCNDVTTCKTCQSASACGTTTTTITPYTPTSNYNYQGSTTSSNDVGAAGPRTVQGVYATCTYSCPSGQVLGGAGNTSCYISTTSYSSPYCSGAGACSGSYTVNSGLQTCQATYSIGVTTSGQGSCSYSYYSEGTGSLTTTSDNGCETGTSGNYRGCKGYTTTTVSCSCTYGNTYVGLAPCSRTETCTAAGQSYPGSGTYCTYVVYDVCASGTASGGRCYTTTTSCAGSYTGSPAGTDCAYLSGYSCPNGGSYNSSTGKCDGTIVTANTCASCSACGSTITSGGTYNASSPPLYGCSNGYTYDTTVAYNYSYTYGFKIVQGSGSSYTVISDNSTTAFPLVIRMTTNGNTLTVDAWSDAAKATSVASGITATNSGTKGTKCGIVRSYSQYQQGNTADNFSAGVI